MPNPFAPAASGSGARAGSSNPFAPSRAGGGTDLEENTSNLEQLQQDTGARDVEQDSPGLLQRIFDLTSRPEYALAGAGEELFTEKGRGLGEALKRGATELTSGLPGLPVGQKKGFAQTLEEHGVGTGGQLSDILPIFSDTGEGLPLQKGGWADWTPRGVGAFIAASAVDPLTYITGGEGGLVKAGGKALSTAGEKLLGREVLQALPEIGKATERASVPIFEGLAGKASSGTGRYLDFSAMSEGARNAARGVLKEKASQFAVRGAVDGLATDLERRGIEVGSDIYAGIRDVARKKAEDNVLAAAASDPSLLNPGGLRFMGRTIPGTPQLSTLASGVSAKVIQAIGETKSGAAVLAATAQVGKAYDALGRVLSRDWITRNLAEYNGLKQVNLDAHAVLTANVHNEIRNSAMAALPKDEAVWRRVVTALIDGDYATKLEGAELDAANDFRSIVDGWATKETQLGLLKVNRERLAQIDAEIDDVADGLTPKYNKNDMRSAEATHKRNLEAAPLEYVEKQTLKHADEAAFYRRRGWELVEEDRGKIVAYRLKETTGAEQQLWRDRIADSRKAIDDLTAGPTEDEIARANHRILALKQEAESFISGPAGPRENYVPSFYQNDPKEIQSAVSLWKHGRINHATIGRHAEERAFPDIVQAEAISRRLHAIDPRYPELNAVWDPVEILRRRGETHADAVAYDQWYKTLRDKVSVDPTFEGYNALPSARGVYRSFGADEREAITETLLSGKDMPEPIWRSLSKDAKEEFVHERLARAKSPQEMLRIVDRYGEEFAPKLQPISGTIAPDGSRYVRLGIPALAGREVPQTVADDLANMTQRIINGDEAATLVKGYDWINNTFKGAVTVAFPSFHFRNAISNVAQSMLDIGLAALDPFRYKQAIAIMSGGEGSMRTAAGEYSFNEIRSLIKQNAVAVERKDILELTGKGATDVAKGAVGKVFRAPGEAAAKVESVSRAVHFIEQLRRGMSPAGAAARSKKFLFDYSDLSRSEREILRRAIPFYTFTRKNIQLQLETLANRPGAVAVQARLFRQRQETQDSLASWQTRNFSIHLGSDGHTVKAITGIDLPVRHLDYIWAGSMRRSVRQALSFLSPVILAPVQVATGTKVFSGQKMERSRSESIGRAIDALNPPKKVKDWLGFIKDTDAAGRPSYSFDGERFYALFESWVLSRVVSTGDREFQQFASNADFSSIALNVLTGTQLKEYNLTEERQKKLKERINQLHESLRQRGAEVQSSHSYVPKEQRQQQQTGNPFSGRGGQ